MANTYIYTPHCAVDADTFVFTSYLQPLNENFKCIPISIYSKSNGKANQDIVKLIYNIIDNFKKMDIFIIAVAMDNDSGYNKEDNDTFLEYFHEFLEKGFDAAVQKISQFDKVYWISDFLHIIKLARKYLIKGNITIRSTTDKVFNPITLENLLKIGLPLNDKSDISFMKDFYPL